MGARSPGNKRVVKLQTYDDDGDDDPADDDAEAEHAGKSSRPHTNITTMTIGISGIDRNTAQGWQRHPSVSP